MITKVDGDSFQERLPKGNREINFKDAVKILCLMAFLLADLIRAVNELIDCHNRTEDVKAGRMLEVEPQENERG